MSEKGTYPLRDLDPLIHITAEQSSEKDKWHCNQPMTRLYGCLRFTDRREARCLYVIFAAFPIPPDVVKTRGVNEPFSTSRTCCSYARLFSPSCCLKHKSKDRLWYVGAFGLKTLTSKYAH